MNKTLHHICCLSAAVGSLLLGPALLDECLAKPAVFHRAATTPDPEPSRPAGYDTFVAEAVLTAKYHGNRWTDGTYTSTYDNRIVKYQYDPGYSYLRLAQEVGGDAELEGYAATALHEWRDEYSIANSGSVLGFYNYTDGLRLDWTENADTTSRDALLDQAVSASYCGLATSIERASDADDVWREPLSREVAYCIEGYINAEVYAGMIHTGKMEALVDCILADPGGTATWIDLVTMPDGGHIEQWLGNYTTDANGDYVSGATEFVSTNFAPFMGALTMHALTRYYDEAASINGGITPDARIIPKVERLLDAIWNETHGTSNNAPDNDSFYYRPNDYDGDGSLNVDDADDSSGETYATINMVAYCYWWAYWKTGEPRHLARGDAAFLASLNLDSLVYRGIATQTYLSKEFQECLRWTIDGFEVRAAGIALHGE